MLAIYCFALFVIASGAIPAFVRLFRLFILLPIKSHGSRTISVMPRHQPVPRESLPPETREFFDFIARELHPAGFEEVGVLGNSGLVSDASGALLRLVNRKTDEAVSAMMARAGTHRNLTYLIRTDFADGVRISTAVNPNVGVWPGNPRDATEVFAFVNEPCQLLEAHRRLLDRQGLSKDPRRQVAATLDQAIARADTDTAERVRWVADRGYYWLDETAGLYRYTWRGAFFTTWRQTPPIKQWRIKRRDRRALRLWRELGMPEPSEAPPLARAASPMGSSLTDPTARQLLYEPVLEIGEVRVTCDSGHATVRAGGITPLQLLTRLRWRLMVAGVYCAGLAFHVHQWWRWRQTLKLVPPAVAAMMRQEAWRFVPLTLLWLGLLAWEALRLVRMFRSARGNALVTASPAGLSFRNATGKLASAEIDRSGIGSLRVVTVPLGRGRSTYALLLRRRNAPRSDVLFTGSDFDAVTLARNALVQAMGIENPPEPVIAQLVSID
jgi:hypothetical protein